FAIPHCKSDDVRFNSMVVLKPRVPVAWDSLDGQPVRVMIMLAIREASGAEAHMKVLARLARRVMDTHFRSLLEQETDPVKLCNILRESFEIQPIQQPD